MTSRSDQEVYEEIRREHEHLRELLGTIRSELNSRAGAVGKVAELVSSLQEHVQEHFREEEEGGFFHEVLTQAPRMSDRAESLKSEHSDLSDAVARCVRTADEEKATWRTLETEFHEFSKSLMHHESKENELLLDAYDEDIGSAD